MVATLACWQYHAERRKYDGKKDKWQHRALRNEEDDL
jgi:hypothetical protein